MFNIIIIKIITFIYRHLSRHSRTQLNSKITVCIKLENTIELKVNASTEQATFKRCVFLKRCVLILALKIRRKNIILIEVWSVLNQLKSLIIYNNNNNDDDKTVRAPKFNRTFLQSYQPALCCTYNYVAFSCNF